MKNLILIAVLSSAAVSHVGAQAINFQVSDPFNSSDAGYTGLGAAPGGTSSDIWNKIQLSGSFDGSSPVTTSNNVDSKGNPSGVTFTDDAAQAYTTNGNGYGQPDPAIGLFASYETALNGGFNRPIITESLNNVAAGTYDLYLYGDNSTFVTPTNGGTGGATFTLNGVSQSIINDGNTSTFQSGVNYVEFTNVSPDTSGNIAFSFTNNGQGAEGDFNGLQLVAVTAPEPSSWALLLGGAVFLMGWSRFRLLSRP